MVRAFVGGMLLLAVALATPEMRSVDRGGSDSLIEQAASPCIVGGAGVDCNRPPNVYCYEASGTCDERSGACVYTPKSEGTRCSNGPPTAPNSYCYSPILACSGKFPGSCLYNPYPYGTKCPSGVCDGAGTCGCVSDADCFRASNGCQVASCVLPPGPSVKPDGTPVVGVCQFSQPTNSNNGAICQKWGRCAFGECTFAVSCGGVLCGLNGFPADFSCQTKYSCSTSAPGGRAGGPVDALLESQTDNGQAEAAAAAAAPPVDPTQTPDIIGSGNYCVNSNLAEGTTCGFTAHGQCQSGFCTEGSGVDPNGNPIAFRATPTKAATTTSTRTSPSAAPTTQ